MTMSETGGDVVHNSEQPKRKLEGELRCYKPARAGDLSFWKAVVLEFLERSSAAARSPSDSTSS